MNIAEHVADQQQELERAVAYALELAKHSCDEAEVAILKTTGLSVSTRFSDVERLAFNSDGALSITVYQQQRKGTATSSDLSAKAIKDALEAALDIARYTSADPYSGLVDKELMAFNPPVVDIFFPDVLNPDQAIELAANAERVALSIDKRIVNSEGSSYNGHYGVKVYGNTHGFLHSYCSSRYSLDCCVIAEQEGRMERDYSYTTARAMDDLKSAEWVGQEAATRTLARLNPRRLPTMQVPVLFAAEVASGLLGHLVSAISGSNLYRKSSFLLNKLDEQIFPSWLTISEYPHLAKGLGSAPFDAEGTQTINRDIIKKGLLQTYLLSSYAARRLNMQATGHSGGIYNWQVSGQQDNLDQLIKKMGKGLLVTRLMGQGVNTVTGDYSRGASGFWIENGEIQYPVNEITIAGNLSQMYRDIVTIGNDIEMRSKIQCGSILISNMKIAGE